MKPIQSIVVPVDFSAGSKAALDYALFVAKKLGASIVALHVVEPPDFVPLDTALANVGTGGPPRTLGEVAREQAREDLEKLLRELDRGDVKVEPRVLTGSAHDTIVEEAPAHDLVVMGTHGRRGLGHLVMGSVAERVVRHSPRPVITVKATAESAT